MSIYLGLPGAFASARIHWSSQALQDVVEATAARHWATGCHPSCPETRVVHILRWIGPGLSFWPIESLKDLLFLFVSTPDSWDLLRSPEFVVYSWYTLTRSLSLKCLSCEPLVTSPWLEEQILSAMSGMMQIPVGTPIAGWWRFQIMFSLFDYWTNMTKLHSGYHNSSHQVGQHQPVWLVPPCDTKIWSPCVAGVKAGTPCPAQIGITCMSFISFIPTRQSWNFWTLTFRTHVTCVDLLPWIQTGCEMWQLGSYRYIYNIYT